MELAGGASIRCRHVKVLLFDQARACGIASPFPRERREGEGLRAECDSKNFFDLFATGAPHLNPLPARGERRIQVDALSTL